MEQKILVVDLDGTLTNSKKEVTPRTREAIRKMQEQGHKVVLASGRPTPGVQPLAKELELNRFGGYTLSYNGGQIRDCKTGEIVYQKTLPEELVPDLFATAEELGMGLMTYQEKEIIANLHSDEYMDLESMITHMEIRHLEDPVKALEQPVNKCLGTAPPDVAPEKEAIYAERFGDRLSISRSEPFFVEITPKGIDKGASLERLCQVTGCRRENMIACGDGFNDRSMIEFAGLGVAMENAQDIVKEVADYVTASNEEDGVAQVIEKFIIA